MSEATIIAAALEKVAEAIDGLAKAVTKAAGTPCPACHGSGYATGTDRCAPCNGTGWKGPESTVDP